MDKLLNLFKEYLLYEKDLARNTVIAYYYDIKILLLFFIENNIIEADIKKLYIFADLDILLFQDFLKTRILSGYNNSSNQRMVIAIKVFFTFLAKKHNIINENINNIDIPKIAKKISKSVSEKNIYLILENIHLFHKKEWLIARDKALIILIYGCGLRISEAFNIKQNDLLNNNNIIIKGKGSKFRSIPLLEIVKEYIDLYLKELPYQISFDDKIFRGSNGGEYNMAIFQRLIIKLRKYLNLSKDITVHSLRHSFATHLLNYGLDIRLIQELLGHNSISTTEKYLKINKRKLFKDYYRLHNR